MTSVEQLVAIQRRQEALLRDIGAGRLGLDLIEVLAKFVSNLITFNYRDADKARAEEAASASNNLPKTTVEDLVRTTADVQKNLPGW